MEYILRTNTVSKKYTNYYAVDKVSISIKKGEIYGLIGENGAGKSTLMKMIAGLVEPSEGSIELFGNFVPQTERYRIGCVIESPALYAELTAKQNLEVFRKAYGLSSKESVQQILKQVGLSQYENKIVKKFSLGMKQRLAIGVALLGNPDFLILDEPINGLDAIIVTLSLIIVLSFYLLHRREVTRLSQKLQTLLHSFTHAELTLDFPSSDITDLVNALNELLRVYHKQVYSLQKKDEAIKETITNLAHDLRTPVTAIQGYTQMLLQSPELSEEDLDAAAVINERLNVLNQLLNQLFEFARIEADEMEFSYTTFDLNAVLRSVAVSFFKSFEERKIIPALSIAEISFPFYGDEKAVTRIFENIVSNALSHGKSDYHFSSYDDNENYHFSFQNFTDSINESDIDKIFNRFYTTDLSRSRKTTGLGLTIAKNLTVKMGGSISASLNNNVFEIVVCFPKQKG